MIFQKIVYLEFLLFLPYLYFWLSAAAFASCISLASASGESSLIPLLRLFLGKRLRWFASEITYISGSLLLQVHRSDC